MFINLIKLYFLGTIQECLNEPILYLYKFEQLKLCNLSYIKENEQKCRKMQFLLKLMEYPEYLNKYILKIQGPIGVRLWNETLIQLSIQLMKLLTHKTHSTLATSIFYV